MLRGGRRMPRDWDTDRRRPKTRHRAALNRERQRRWRERQSRVPPDWMKACDQCEEERKAAALAAGVWPGVPARP